MWNKPSNSTGSDGSTVTASSANGKVKVNGTDITVYDDTALNTKVTRLDKYGESSGLPTFNGIVIGSGAEIGGESITAQIKTANLFDKDTAINGYYSSTTGAFTNTTIWKTSNYINCLANDVFKTNLGAGNICFWDTSKVFVSGTVISGSTVTVTVPNTEIIRYVTFTVTPANTDSYMVGKNEVPTVYVPYYVNILVSKIKTSRVAGKKWHCLGDSITAEPEGYHKWLSADYGVLPNNYGVNATTIAKRSGRTDSMLERYVSMADGADIITVLGGTNDFGNAVPLGTLGSTDETTFYGAYESLVRGLIGKYHGKAIGLFTPIPRRSDTGGLATYADAIINVAKKFSIPCLDLYRSAGLDPHFDIINNTYFKIQDGLHPNAEGHKILARRIIHFLESI